MMLCLGLFVFHINTAAYQQLQHATSQRWASNNRIGSRPAYQYLGPGEESITLNGTLYPGFMAGQSKLFIGGESSLSILKAMADSGLAHTLISGNGTLHGLWLIDSISETQTLFFKDGSPRKIDFTLKMKRIDDDRIDLLGDLTSYINNVIRTSLRVLR